MAAVPTDSPLLWRTAVLDHYDGLTWFPASGEPPSPVGAAGQVPDVLGPAGAAPAGRRLRDDGVEVLDGFSGVLLAPSRAVGIGGTTGAYVTDGATVVVDRLRGAERGYDASTDVPPAVEDVVASGGSASRDAGPGDGTGEVGRWTALPAGVTQRTRDLAAAVTAGASTPAEKVLVVRAHLRATYAYDLESPVPPPGQDAVDHFLFDARRGFCEQFAAAEVVMLRSLGVPARMATGFSAEAGAAGRDDGLRVLRAADADAWVEAWVPGQGWVTADPTASAATQDLGSRVLSVLTRAFTDRPWRLALAVGLVVLSGLVAAAVRTARPGPARGGRNGVRGGRQRTGRTGAELLEAYDRLGRSLAATGRASPASQTLDELAVRLPGGLGALRVLERLSYGPSGVPTAETLHAAAELDRLTAEVLATAPA